MRTLDDLFKRYPGFWFRVLFESFLPTTIAIVWISKSYLKKPELFDAVSAGCVAFGFALFVQGQFLRIAKNVRDDRHFREVEARFQEHKHSFASVEQALEQLHYTQAQWENYFSDANISVIPRTKAPEKSFVEGLYEEVDRGDLQNAVSSAAFVFEQALRFEAEHLFYGEHSPLIEIVEKLEADITNREQYNHIKYLLTLRNSIKYRTIKVDSRETAVSFIDAFEKGKKILRSYQSQLYAHKSKNAG